MGKVDYLPQIVMGRISRTIFCFVFFVSALSALTDRSMAQGSLGEPRSRADSNSGLDSSDPGLGFDRPFLNQEDLQREKIRAEAEARRRLELEKRFNQLSPQRQNQRAKDLSRSKDKSSFGDFGDQEIAPGLIEPEMSKDQPSRENSALQKNGEDLRTTQPDYFNAIPGSQRSTVEEIFTGLYPSEISRELTQFGYDLFSPASVGFLPSNSSTTDIPVSKDYVLGPGDTFTINVWGSNNFSYTVTVRADGNIFIPKLGTISVWGKSFSQASAQIERKFSDFFSGIKVNIAFETIRSIDVFVVGEVVQPGRYAVSSTSAALNALVQAGGPTKSGSLRNIKIIRNNKEVASVDLYEFLIDGKINNQKLQSQDVILVPVIGKLAAIAGHPKRPGIYEWKDSTTVYDLIMMAGGLKFTGFAGRLSLERVLENQKRVTRDFNIPTNFKDLSREQALKTDLGSKVDDGDLVSIFSVLPEKFGTVTLKGHVRRPGAYEFKEGMKLSALIRSFDDLKPESYTSYVQIIRTTPPTDSQIAMFTSLDEALKGNAAYNVELKDRDIIVVFSKAELRLRDKVSIFGKVNKPGEFAYFKGMTLKDLILMAGNLTQDAYQASAEIARFKVENDQIKVDRLQVDLRAALSPAGANQAAINPFLEPKDRVSVYGLSNFETKNYIDIEGAVQFPGRYSFLPNERLSSILARSGGFTKNAFLKGSIFSRESVRELQERSLKEQITRLEEAILNENLRAGQNSASVQDAAGQQESLNARRALLRNLEAAKASGRMILDLTDLNKFKNSPQDIMLEPGDKLSIPVEPSVVNVMGEVFNQSSVVYQKGETLSYYLDRAGGVSPNGDGSSIFIIHANGSVSSRKQSRGFLLNDFMRTKVERGDTILVPKDISRFSWLSSTKDFTEILFKIASTTGITITAFK